MKPFAIKIKRFERTTDRIYLLNDLMINRKAFTLDETSLVREEPEEIIIHETYHGEALGRTGEKIFLGIPTPEGEKKWYFLGHQEVYKLFLEDPKETLWEAFDFPRAFNTKLPLTGCSFVVCPFCDRPTIDKSRDSLFLCPKDGWVHPRAELVEVKGEL